MAEMGEEIYRAFSENLSGAEILKKLVREKARGREWGWGRKTLPTNVAKYALGRDDDGEDQYMILMDVDGKREHHRTVKLPASGDIQSFDDDEVDDIASSIFDDDTLLDRLLTATGKSQLSMICDAETLHLEQSQKGRLSAILWKFIVTNLNSDNPDVLVAVGSAIRKYVGMLSVDRIGEVGALLETDSHPMLHLDIELEIVKMTYRKFEANPQVATDRFAKLGERFWETAQDYLRPRFLGRDKYAAGASLLIASIVAMRSRFSDQALASALASPYSWFGEKVIADLRNLADRWKFKNAESSDWCIRLVDDAMKSHNGNIGAFKASQ
ncbi:MAG TPA: hypothetical protein VFE47_08690 [Tepidisphaeraceae bacterium]|jgi:hypothetical protein|nr:hypothetical protein [Tepidisphaeraceae bacterium]